MPSESPTPPPPIPRDPSPRQVRRASRRRYDASNPGRRMRRRAFAVAATTLGAYTVFVTAALFAAAHESARGERAAAAAQRQLTPKGILAGRPLADLRRSHAQFARAARRMGGAALAPVRILPVAGRQVRAAHDLAGAAAIASSAAIDATQQARALITRTDHPTGHDRIVLLRGLAAIASRTQRRIDSAALGPRQGLLPSIARAHNRLALRFDRADAALAAGSQAAAATADLLNGPGRYLVVAANNSEMRAGSGMWLQGGELTTHDGAIALTGMRSLPDDAVVAPDAVQPTGDFAARWGYLHPGREWRNLMLSPRFDVSAELASRMWVAAGNQPVDGVICIDPVVLQAILHATGPVEVAGKKIRGRDVLEEILHDQYLLFPTSANRDLQTRRERLGEIAGAAFGAFDRGGWDVATLAADLGHAASGRHLMVWSRTPTTQKAWRLAGVSGTVPANTLFVGVENRGGNKLDHFLDVSVDADLHDAEAANTGAGTEITLKIRLRNRTPNGEPVYVAGPHLDSGGQEGDYIGIVSVTMPGIARDFLIDGVTGYAVLGPDGPTQVMAIGVTVKRGQEQTVVGHFRLPSDAIHNRTLAIPSSARIPALVWRTRTSKWRDVGLHTLPLP